MNVLKYIKNNPKKSIVGTIICGYVGKWLNGLYQDHEFRHAICRNIMVKGTENVRWQYSPRTITVFLNPAANYGKASKLFEKNAAPIFHLSGCNVKVIQLDYEGQAKQLMSILEQGSTDIIVAAGGNATVNEIVTGLMRRPDYQSWLNIPIGVIPLGETNTLCKQLCGNGNQERLSQWIMTATNDILKTSSKQVDLMEITSENGKSVYALSDMRWGSYSDAFSRTSKYWFWGPLKKYMTFIFASFKSKIKEPRQIELNYCEPLPFVEPEKTVEKPVVSDPVFAKIKELFVWVLKPLVKFSDSKPVGTSVIKPREMDLDKSESFETLEFSASVNSANINAQKYQAAAQISIENKDFSSLDFIKNGLKRFESAYPQPIHPKADFSACQFQILLNTEEETWFRIDNEDFEAVPCTIKVLPKAIKLICSEQ